MTKHKKIVLAYSGGLDTSIAVQWLLEHKAEEVIAVVIDVGQKEDNLDAVRDKALKVGASKAFVIDARKAFIQDYVWKSLKANARYEMGYPLATAIARPLIAKLIDDIAKQEGADALAHGCTGKGNDQVRFELAWQALSPNVPVVAPAREWGELCDRQKAIAYADQHGIPVPISKKSPYSIDLNLWGRSAECGALEDATLEAPSDAYFMTVAPEQAPGEPEYIDVYFEKGIPTALNGQALDGITLVERLNEMAGKHGIGRYDQIENRLVGIKSREIYEAPAATVLLIAHKELEYLVNPKDLMHFKATIDQKYAELIYNGLWFSPMRDALDAFIEQTQERVTGQLRLKLYKGNCTVVGRQAPLSLYDQHLATYAEDDTFDHLAAPGFIKLFGLGNKTYYAQGQEPN